MMEENSGINRKSFKLTTKNKEEEINENSDDDKSGSWADEEREEEDDEQEEEAQGKGSEDENDELAALNEDQELSVEELLKKYKYYDEQVTTVATAVCSTNGTQQQIVSETKISITKNNDASSEQPTSSAHQHGYFSESDDEVDEDYVPPEIWRRSIRVGDDYQVLVPESTQTELVGHEEGAGVALWTNQLKGRRVEENEGNPLLYDVMHLVMCFLRSAYTDRPPLKRPRIDANPARIDGDPLTDEMCGQTLRDDEDALYIYMTSTFDVPTALHHYHQLRERQLSLRSQPATPVAPASESHQDGLLTAVANAAASNEEPIWASSPDERVKHKLSDGRLWSETECEQFEEGLRLFGKNFPKIRTDLLHHRSVRELVQFYYMWKKTERHDLFVQRVRFEKPYLKLHPNSTDYMDRLIDQMEGATGGPDQLTPLSLPIVSSVYESDSGPPSDSHGASLMSHDPKHMLGLFHNSHFNEWGGAAQHEPSAHLPHLDSITVDHILHQ